MAGRQAHWVLGLGLVSGLVASILGFFVPKDMLPWVGDVPGLSFLHEEEEEEEEGGLRPDSPGEWAGFRKRQQADEKGVVAANGAVVAMGRRKALARAGTLAGLGRGMQQAAVAGVTPGATGGSWTWIGPGNIGGRSRAIVIDPSNPSRMLLGSAGGGIWSSVNGGASWTAVADFLGSLAVSALALSPANPAVVYAGTGEGFFNCDSLRGAGIFKSSDGGVTWGQLAATNPSVNSDWLHVNRIAVHPTNPNIILAATGGVSAGVRCSDAPASAGGLYRSTNAGASWTKVFSTAGVVDVRFQPTLGNNAIISVRLGFSNYAVYYSNDSGSSWALSNLASGSGGRKEIAYSGTSAYLSVDNSTNGTSGQVWSSVNGGATWVLKGTPNHLNGQGWYANAIWADPTNAQHLIVGGLDLWRSVNGGTSWARISDWTATPNSAHADHHVIVSSPGYGTGDRTIYFGNDGGIYKTADIQAVTSPAVGWTSLNNGLGVTQFYDGAGQMVNGTTPLIVGGTQDNGSLFYLNNGTTQWERYFGGDGGFSAVDASTPSMTRAYGEYVYLMLHRADGLDKRFAGGSYATRNIYAGIGDAGNSATSLFIAPFALDPNNPSIMYAGGASLWRSTNVTDTYPAWTSVAASGSIISQIAVAEGLSSTVWFGTTKGAMFASTTATPAFTSRSAGLPARMVLSILIDKRAPSTVYAGFGGYVTSNIYKTTNAGASWTNIHGNLPAVPIYSIVGHPTKPSFLYVGTEVGVFASEDGGATWSTSNDGPANVAVVKLFWLNNTTLVAATHGRGMFTANIPESTEVLSVAKAGNGTGTVASAPTGINCGATCSASFVVSAKVILTASPAAGSVFAGWSGACSGSGTCTVPMATAQNVTATFSLQTYPLSISKAGNGTGSITSTPAGISCGAICTSSFVTGTSVTLSASPAAGSLFTGWSGACSGTGACTVAMSAAQDVTATFTLQIFPLTISKTGNGAGTVTSTPAGISCGTACSLGLVSNSQVTLAATPAAGSLFAGWSGACSGTGACTVAMAAAQNVTASFTLQIFPLTVSKAGNGAGMVTSTPAGISCGAACTVGLLANSLVTLAATPAAGSVFAGWSGACGGTAACIVPMSAAQSVTATFTLQIFPLTVSKTGNGAGTVTSTPAGISCGATCAVGLFANSQVTLAAIPATGSLFTGWSGACSGTGICSVAMSAAQDVTATFALQIFALTVSKAGNGVGTVTSTPAGISCGATCAVGLVSNSQPSLSALPAPGSVFAGWSGACSGMGVCTVAMSAAQTVMATFALQTYPLTVSKAGNGAGTVTSTPAGISCGATCTVSPLANSQVTLSGTPAAGSLFTGWSGACSGTGACTVAMSAAQSVTASFTLQTYALSVSKAGNGSGTVASTPSGISCGAICTSGFATGTSVALIASPGAGSVFAGWSGACSGTGACTVAMSAAQNVTASFTLQSFRLTVSRAGNGAGTVVGTSVGINCGASCAVNLLANTQVTLSAMPSAGSLFAGWSGACGGTGACTVAMSAAQNVTATFSLPVVVYGLTLTTTGAGTITSAAPGANCASACMASFTAGSTLVLSATPVAGYVFAGWSGACTGTGTCSLAMTSAMAVEARFTLLPLSPVSMLSNGAVITKLGGASGSIQTFAINVSSGGRNLVVAISGGSGNADLYVRYGQRPFVGLGLDCAPRNGSSSEICQFATPASGTYFIMVHAPSAYAGVTLRAAYTVTNSKR